MISERKVYIYIQLPMDYIAPAILPKCFLLETPADVS